MADDRSTELSASCGVSIDYFSHGLPPLASPYMLKSKYDGEEHRFVMLESTLGFDAAFTIGSLKPEFALLTEFWVPLENSVADEFIRERIHLRKFTMYLPVHENLSLTIGKNRFLIGWQQPTEFHRVGLQLLSHSGNLSGYYPQLRLDYFFRSLRFQYSLMTIDHDAHDAEEVLADESA